MAGNGGMTLHLQSIQPNLERCHLGKHTDQRESTLKPWVLPISPYTGLGALWAPAGRASKPCVLLGPQSCSFCFDFKQIGCGFKHISSVTHSCLRFFIWKVTLHLLELPIKVSPNSLVWAVSAKAESGQADLCSGRHCPLSLILPWTGRQSHPSGKVWNPGLCPKCAAKLSPVRPVPAPHYSLGLLSLEMHVGLRTPFYCLVYLASHCPSAVSSVFLCLVTPQPQSIPHPAHHHLGFIPKP